MHFKIKDGVTIHRKSATAIVLRRSDYEYTLENVPDTFEEFILFFTGDYTLAEIIQRAEKIQINPSVAEKLISKLFDTGILIDSRIKNDVTKLSTLGREKIIEERSALSLQSTSPFIDQHIINKRQKTKVHIYDINIITYGISISLFLSGIKNFSFENTKENIMPLEMNDISISGLSTAKIGTPKITVLKNHLTDLGATIVQKEDSPSIRICNEPLKEKYIAHTSTQLYIKSFPTYATIGPLIIPSLTPCYTCDISFQSDQNNKKQYWQNISFPCKANVNQSTTLELFQVSYATAMILDAVDNNSTFNKPSFAGKSVIIKMPGPEIFFYNHSFHPSCKNCSDILDVTAAASSIDKQ